jgi:hypothetical protein
MEQIKDYISYFLYSLSPVQLNIIAGASVLIVLYLIAKMFGRAAVMTVLVIALMVYAIFSADLIDNAKFYLNGLYEHSRDINKY